MVFDGQPPSYPSGGPMMKLALAAADGTIESIAL